MAFKVWARPVRQHRRAIEKGIDNCNSTAKMYEHFRKRGHSSSVMRFIAIESVEGRFEGDED